MCAIIKRLEQGGKTYIDPAPTIEDTARKEILENKCPYLIERKIGYRTELVEVLSVNDMTCPQDVVDYEFLN